jgi:hypothetical protein
MAAVLLGRVPDDVITRPIRLFGVRVELTSPPPDDGSTDARASSGASDC